MQLFGPRVRLGYALVVLLTFTRTLQAQAEKPRVRASVRASVRARVRARVRVRVCLIPTLSPPLSPSPST